MIANKIDTERVFEIIADAVNSNFESKSEITIEHALREESKRLGKRSLFGIYYDDSPVINILYRYKYISDRSSGASVKAMKPIPTHHTSNGRVLIRFDFDSFKLYAKMPFSPPVRRFKCGYVVSDLESDWHDAMIDNIRAPQID
jgi:hypothetical protein